MSRQQFNSRNNINDVILLQKSGSTSSFDPTITYSSGTKRVSWRLYNGSETTQTAGNSITYTGFTSDTSIRTIEMRGTNFKNITGFELNNDNLYGGLNLSGMKNLSSFNMSQNTNLTGITHSQSDNIFTLYNLTSCNITGNHNMSMFPNLGGGFFISSNPNLTGITHTATTQVFTNYWATSCNLTGNLDLSQLSKLGGQLDIRTNPNLTGLTHPNTDQIFTYYGVNSCNLIGNLNVPFTGLGGTFNVGGNSGLTGITHVQSDQIFVSYNGNSCNITGNHTIPFSGLGGSFQITLNSNLTGLTHYTSNRYFTLYNVSLNNITGTHDISMLNNLGGSGITSTGSIRMYGNVLLTDILFPTVTTYLRNGTNSETGSALALSLCDLNYVDFNPLSGVTFISGITQSNPRIQLNDNAMSAGDVNHILDDFKTIATNNPTGWVNINLNIGGTNTDPDSSSGGYDGLAAIATLTGSPYNWTITY